MKNKFLFVIAFLMTLTFSFKTSADSIPIRGIVEGYYGTPYTNEDRIDLFKFCKAHKFNAYIYAPKDDLYHRAKWRLPYPKSKLNELKTLIQSAQKNKVKFIFAVSPGLDLNFSEEDLKLMIAKLESIYEIGCRDFAIFFDDIENKDGLSQAKFLNRLEKEFVTVHKDISPLITVPTEYFRKDMHNEGRIKTYTEEFSKTLSKNILVLYTGEGVVQPELNDEQYQMANEIYNRDLGLWINYPVNDYMESKLALGAIDKLPVESKVPAVFFNPMKYAQLSKITLATGADYAHNPKKYNATKSWNKAINEQFGDLAEDFKLFANHSQHLQNNWANIGQADGEDLRKLFDKMLSNPNQQNYQLTKIQLEKLIESTNQLQKNLPKEMLIECEPQLKQFRLILNADLIALEVLMKRQKLSELCRMNEEIKLNEEKVKISDECARKFINEVIECES